MLTESAFESRRSYLDVDDPKEAKARPLPQEYPQGTSHQKRPRLYVQSTIMQMAECRPRAILHDQSS